MPNVDSLQRPDSEKSFQLWLHNTKPLKLNSVLISDPSQFSSVQLLSHVWLFVTPWTAACQASLSIANFQSLLKLMSIESVTLSNHLILCHPLLLLLSVFPNIRVFSSESVLHTIWPKCWSFSFSISPSNEYSGLISLRIDWFDPLIVWGTLWPRYIELVRYCFQGQRIDIN